MCTTSRCSRSGLITKLDYMSYRLNIHCIKLYSEAHLVASSLSRVFSLFAHLRTWSKPRRSRSGLMTCGVCISHSLDRSSVRSTKPPGLACHRFQRKSYGWIFGGCDSRRFLDTTGKCVHKCNTLTLVSMIGRLDYQMDGLVYFDQTQMALGNYFGIFVTS
jgi:hypothetical protein